MGELEKSSDKVTTESGVAVSRKNLRPYKGDYHAVYEYDYYEVKTRDDNKYKIDAEDYERITKAINGGAKFISFGEDLANVNYIDKITKKIGYIS